MYKVPVSTHVPLFLHGKSAHVTSGIIITAYNVKYCFKIRHAGIILKPVNLNKLLYRCCVSGLIIVNFCFNIAGLFDI